MSVTRIQQSIEGVIKYLSEHLDECRYIDKYAIKTACAKWTLSCGCIQRLGKIRSCSTIIA